jgi:hypothetical protein
MNTKKNNQSEAYFYKMDISEIPSLLSLGVPNI